MMMGVVDDYLNDELEYVNCHCEQFLQPSFSPHRKCPLIRPHTAEMTQWQNRKTGWRHSTSWRCAVPPHGWVPRGGGPDEEAAPQTSPSNTTRTRTG